MINIVAKTISQENLSIDDILAAKIRKYHHLIFSV